MLLGSSCKIHFNKQETAEAPKFLLVSVRLPNNPKRSLLKSWMIYCNHVNVKLIIDTSRLLEMYEDMRAFAFCEIHNRLQ